MPRIDYSLGILKLRAKLNLTQEQLADLLKVSYISVNRWENNRYMPTKLVKVKLLQLFKENNIDLES